MWPDPERPLFFDRQGQPIDVLDWARKHEDLDYHFVAQHWVRGWMVGTIWIGLDSGSGFIFGGPPMIFETMAFPPGDEAGGESVYQGQYEERYATEVAAQAGHDRALAWVVEKLGPDSVADITGPLVAGTSDEAADWDQMC